MSDFEKSELLCQGAEGRVYATAFLDRPAVVKERLSKKYRVKELDTKINKQRLLQEARCMVRCRRAGIRTPCIFQMDPDNGRMCMERILGQTFKEFLWSNSNDYASELCVELASKVGKSIGKMHLAEVIHGDLTTSNIMIDDPSLSCGAIKTTQTAPEIVLIDFGLGSMTSTIEEKAVDLYVLERAFISTHPGSEALVSRIMESYRFSWGKGTIVLAKLEQVRLRGRKREMVG